MTTPGDPNQGPEREPGGYGAADQGAGRPPPPGGGGPEPGQGGYGPEPPPGYPPGGGPRPGGAGFATTALVLGILSLFLLPVCGIGVLLALLGLIFGIVALVRGGGRGRAIAGMVLSAVTLLLALFFVLWVADSGVTDCFDPERYPTQNDMRRCLEDRYGVRWR